ncbi:MAG: T9SS type A sorting domain-containing protein [Chlorobi bacterium]|nr:T9SS type A sorting domain-containing protein [Chlorobiota bacterium]
MKKKNLFIISSIITLLVVALFVITQYSGSNKNNEVIANTKENYKFDSPDKFYELEKEIRTGVDEEKPGYPINYRYKELQKAKKVSLPSKSKSISWQERGPGNVPGRTRTIVVDPDDSTKSTWYAGSVGGGVWKTTDRGASWIDLTFDMPNIAVTSLAMAESNHNVMYAGTGEGGFGNTDGIDGGGIFKTTDRGNTWELLESTNNFYFQSVNRLIVDPENENVVLACAIPYASIYRSNNGGQSWDTVFQSFTSGRIQDLVATPGNFNILYAASNSTGVLKSTDRGLTWTKYSSGFLGTRRIELAVAKQNTSIVYAAVEGTETGNNSNLYVSLNAGENWELVEEQSGNNVLWLGSQGWYDNTIEVNPFTDSIVYVGGIQLWKITVYGLTAGNNSEINKVSEYLTDAYHQYDGKNDNVHVDQHFITTIANTDTTFCLLTGCDGGVFVSDYDINPGFVDNSWTMAGMTYNTSQFYGADKKPGESAYVGGTQDNGTWISPANSTENSEWTLAFWADGFESVWSYSNPLNIIGGSQYNGFKRTINGGESFEIATKGLEGDAPFISRIADSKSDGELLFAVTSNGIGRTDNFAEDWVMTYIPNWGLSSYTDVTVSIANPQIVWAGALMNSSRTVFVSQNSGLSFSETSIFKPIGAVTAVETHPVNEKEAFVLFSVYSQPKILRTYNLGQSWEDISGFDESSTSSGFPNVAVYSLLVMPYDTSVIWAGTDIGLFESVDNGNNWAYVNNGMPAVSIWQMKIVDDQVVFATHGRGIWSATIPELSGYEPPATLLAPSVTDLYQIISEQIVLNANIKLRDSYDSTQIFINDEYLETIGFNDDVLELSRSLILTNNNADELSIYLKAFKNGKSFYSGKRKTSIIHLQASKHKYMNDFDAGSSDFTQQGIYINSYPGFTGKAIHSRHKYQDDTESIIYLNVPIILNTDSAMIEYNDVVIVEPGEEGTVYGDFYFWDYVVVEASKDGINWFPLEDGYDARYDTKWLTAYNNNESGNSDMFVNHRINMLNTFSPQDTVVIRFRLFADENTNAWGWVVDDLKIQESSVEAEELVKETNDKLLIYPNPSSGLFNVYFNDNNFKDYTCEVYDVSGRIVKRLNTANGNTDKLQINLANQKTGVYYIRLVNQNNTITQKVQVLR